MAESGEGSISSSSSSISSSVDEDAVEAMPSSEWFATFCNTLHTIELLFTLASALFVLVHRRKGIIALGQPHLLLLLCFGSQVFATGYVVYKMTPPFGPLEHASYCIVGFWLIFIGFSTMSTSIFCRLYRVYKVSRFRRRQPVYTHHVLWPWALAILMSVTVLITVEFLDLGSETVVAGSTSFCHDLRGGKQVFVTYFIYGSHVVLLGGIFLFAWKLRNLSEELGDSRKIFFIVCINVFTFALCLITEVCIKKFNLLGLGPKQRYYFFSATKDLLRFVYIMSSVGGLIVPRMYYVWYEWVHGQLPEHVQMYGTGQVRVTHIGSTITGTITTDTDTGTGTGTGISTMRSTSSIINNTFRGMMDSVRSMGSSRIIVASGSRSKIASGNAANSVGRIDENFGTNDNVIGCIDEGHTSNNNNNNTDDTNANDNDNANDNHKDDGIGIGIGIGSINEAHTTIDIGSANDIGDTNDKDDCIVSINDAGSEGSEGRNDCAASPV
eukprot:CAMPEP_0172387622 /NCGR_PEP_ID=MMETSP1061-20121228/4906_1 /TAXON_ID=37318 /ORGANISM="Pseudo-nitzschia pungens, Strain cf. pungens" /LENGTH=496 /DNA_ID=CAMNT_0013117319 /DNA_START=79 /DNA_END=1569 /DNA_ORIENTATION=-